MRRCSAMIAALGGCLLLSAGGSTPTFASTAKAHMYWQGVAAVLPSDAATASTQVVSIDSVSCGSPRNCSAVGTYLGRSRVAHGLLLTETAGGWAAGVEARLPSNADHDQTLGLSIDSVSCSSPGNCSAVGSYTDDSGNLQGLLLTETAGAWGAGVEAALPADATTTGQLVFLHSVSCPSDGDCSAVGEYNVNSDTHGVLLTETAGTWSTGEEAATPGNAEVGTVSSVSCPSPGNCSAVGEYDDSSGNLQGLLLTETAGVWGTGVEAASPSNASAASGGAYLISVSCASAGNCSAVGRYDDHGGDGDGLLLTEQAGTWEPGNEAVPPANAAPYGVSLNAVSCASAGNCAVVGDYTDDSLHELPLVLSETAGVWSNGAKSPLPANAASPEPEAALYSVSCAAPGSCGAVGDYSDKSEGQPALLLTETAGRWKAAAAPLPSKANSPASHSAQLVSVSCLAAQYCTGVGSFLAGKRTVDGLMLDGTPTPPCVVPRLKGRPLVAAEQSIKSHGCSVGKIERVRSRTISRGHVISQRPGPGRHLRHGAKVSLVVSTGR